VPSRSGLIKTIVTVFSGAAVSAAPFLLAGPRRSSAIPAFGWGVYQIYWGRASTRFRDRLRGIANELGARPDYVMFYRDLDRPFPSPAVEVIREFGSTPIISLELWSWHESKRKRLPDIASGLYDDIFREWAKDARRVGGLILLRFGFEFNGDWFSWSGEPDLFVRAWRRIHGIFDEAGADNVEWVWSPNVTSHPDAPENDAHRYYPGDEFVDWVGVDGYNWGDDYSRWHRWLPFERIFADVLDQFEERYPDKPIMIAEFGCPEDSDSGRKAKWIRDAHGFIRSRPRIEAAIWFNYDKRREGELNFRLDSSASSLAAFKETFAGNEPRRH
jgi:hypothetical protein